jgi:hypothetical protein
MHPAAAEMHSSQRLGSRPASAIQDREWKYGAQNRLSSVGSATVSECRGSSTCSIESPEVAARMRPICEPANEQNLDRLEAELSRTV